MLDLNWLAIIVSAIVFFAIGAAWFSRPLFLKPWMKAAGLSEDYASGGNQGLIFGGAFVLILLMAVTLAWLTDPFDWAGTVLTSLAAGLGFSALSFWMLSLFERKPFAYAAINGGYLLVGFVAMGAILGAWK